VRILVLGGTLFLGRHVVDVALARGHDVVLFNRGRRNPHLFPEIEKLRGDRDGDLAALRGRRFDAVIDPSGYRPEQVRAVADVLGGAIAHYTFISSISVYRELLPHRSFDEHAPRAEGEQGYGALKARCEDALEETMPGRVARVRPGLIVGPHDPTDRFTYWPRRVARGGKVLAPGHLLMALRYIARNARDKGADPARYPWSSYPGVIGTRPCWPFIAKTRVLELFGSAEVAVRMLRDFIEEERRPAEPGGGGEGTGGVRPRPP